MNTNALALYKQYYIDRNNENLEQFTLIADMFGVKNALYPGSYVHITPSFAFPSVTYIDTDRKAKSFFRDPAVLDYIRERKRYPVEPSVTFVPEDYRKNPLKEAPEFDLLISLYAGFISKYCRQYLKDGGYLLANNSHGDASMASIRGNFKLIGVFDRRDLKYRYSDENLDAYLVPKKSVAITEEYLESLGRGIGYTKSPTSYLFQKISASVS